MDTSCLQAHLFGASSANLLRIHDSIDVKIEELYNLLSLLSNSDAILSPVAGTGVHPSPLVQEIIGLAETSE